MDALQTVKPHPNVTADRRVYTDSTESLLLDEGDERAAVMIAAPGQRVAAIWIAKLGLHVVDGVLCQIAAESEKQRQQLKHVEKPVETKQAKPRATKKRAAKKQ